jgi:crotonobetainyl-CoA:carnitine CoA-transferase CaiB-like acyl-CoA transferase
MPAAALATATRSLREDEQRLAVAVGPSLGRPAAAPHAVLHMASYPGPTYDGVPAIGEHTMSVLTEALELALAELEELAERGIIGPA